ncbi:MAG: FAD:protein FMN transferase [Mariprofundaceae bacterium]|nr:FAD:protein FMN transferase [Mariprofundaceae bacterium]
MSSRIAATENWPLFKMSRPLLLVRLVLFAIAAVLVTASCSSQIPDVRESRFMMGTLVQFTIADTQQDKALEAIRAATDEMQRIADAFTIYADKTNAVKAFNTSEADSSVVLPQEVGDLLQTALNISQQSGGAFTPAIGSLSLLWGFSLPDPPTQPPVETAIVRALRGVDAGLIAFNGKTWKRLHSETKLDFGGIAKGYAIDRGIEVLREHGIKNAIVDAGGDLRAIGSHNGTPWRIGIRHPRKDGKTLGWLEVHGDISIVTSGDYERFFMYQGKRYHHILDPQSGHPARHSISATVIAKNATLADAWSTALFVQGAKALPLLNGKGMQGIVMDAGQKIYTGSVALVPFHSESSKQDRQ